MLDLNESFGMRGKVALITGAASGIGLGISRFFALAGVSVAMLDINEEGGGKAKGVVEGDREFFFCDVTDSSSCVTAVEGVLSRFGRIDILVNCAGVARRNDVVGLDERDWDLALNVTLKSVFLMSKAVVPYMKAQGGGKIVNIGSGWSLKGGPMAISYCAAKGGVWNMTRAMAIDHGPDNINVNCVCPGDIDTPMLKSECEQLGGTYDESYKEECAQRPIKRLGTPEDVAKSVFFLCSDMAPWVTGSSLVVDGGGIA
ncbi:SDR family NAD(P)-dependent oxidoreductase [Dethiosulfovibrio salsuginis]|uniref:NAD(P)-dependent dehydrogenase, short-chain alcohol dehydrogenase family n=1 Tax=Dethiosulfovibrio salsuginis TaxID=561720 RepID=A0A1X7JCY7_9BACT|nr:SDR family oxidoreductase [Dethiosulfovibrio salsuginis]SMG25404.1 NAD(P)-dependent dehydrogenase, short-chain alcohol dehydrogenase family [Dethiosulfovibrio salsuginis]